jgi:poly-beta-1,6-N-acetyl-D-glucosamine synthase
MATLVFAACLAVLVYTYIGFPVLMALLARLVPRPFARRPIQPRVTMIIAAYNEEKTIREKIENTLALDYPSDRLDIVVAADGSDDRTADIVRGYEPRVRLLHAPTRAGKTAALSRAVRASNGEILLFSDANTMYGAAVVSTLVRNFADSNVGGVTGRKVVARDLERETTEGETAYWQYESWLKQSESAVGSIVTADGEIFAMRRELFDYPDRSVVHDDMYLTLRIIERGYRVVYEPAAVSMEASSRTVADEFHLKVRYASAGYQIVHLFSRMLCPPTSFFALEFLSHKVLRWLAPVFLLGAFVSSFWLPFARLVVPVELAFLALAAIGALGRAHRPPFIVYAPFYFSAMNAAALWGLLRYASSGQTTHWRKAQR